MAEAAAVVKVSAAVAVVRRRSRHDDLDLAHSHAVFEAQSAAVFEASAAVFETSGSAAEGREIHSARGSMTVYTLHILHISGATIRGPFLSSLGECPT